MCKMKAANISRPLLIFPSIMEISFAIFSDSFFIAFKKEFMLFKIKMTYSNKKIEPTVKKIKKMLIA